MRAFSRVWGFFLFAAVFSAAGLMTVSPSEATWADRPPNAAAMARALDASSPIPFAAPWTDTVAVGDDDLLPPVTTASGADDLWHNVPITVTFTAADAGSGVAYTEYKLDDADWARGTQVTVSAPGDHSGDGAHVLLFRSADAAGNLEDPPGSLTVKIDTTAPVTNVVGAQDAGWYNGPLTLSFGAATEAGSGVAYTEYELDSGDWVRGAEVTVAAPSDHSGDGPHAVLFRSADAAGNLEGTHTLAFGIDTARPTTRAPYAVTVMRYRTATLTYKVVDTAPNGGTAAVTITIRNRAGTVVKRLALAARPVNTLLKASFTCRLGEGSYRFFVHASDTAHNKEALAGSNRLRVTAPWSIGLPFRFRVGGLRLRDIAPSAYPLLAPKAMPKTDTEVHDSQGVRMFWYGGRLYNHVVAQATFGLRNLNAYTRTRDPFFLRRAQAQARRLIARRDLSGSAWFHPYDFAFQLMTPPWYSAMGQGLCLPLFCGLYKVTGTSTYLQAAQGTFASFLRRGPSSLPWVVNVDPYGYLWLQEYPASSPDYTLNGHIYAAFGLYDYYRLRHDKRARELFNGAATTVLHYASQFRQPGWMSYYCLAHHQLAGEKYHAIHVGQFLTLYRLTGTTAFARLADSFQADYPAPAVSGSIKVVPGTYTGLRFDSAGRTISRRTWRVTKATYLPVTRRERIRYQTGYWFATSSGPWTGYHLREQAGKVFLPGVLLFNAYDPPRRLVMPAGHVYVGRRYDAHGRVTATTTLTTTPSAATTNRRATVNGADQVRVASGPLKGYWLHLGPAVLR